ncbi:MAG: hypothetical protein KBF88_13250 [Polyangiaceae bacterium]|nr:hypothetical protein [Polyangiaceae bacterium]
MSEEMIHKLLADLPESNLTTTVLKGLDYLVPGEWTNIRSLEDMCKAVTGEEDQELLQKVGDRAIELYIDPSNGYQRAVTVFKGVDSIGTAAGALSILHGLGARFDGLSFLKDMGPKDSSAQAVDAGMKFAAEFATFCLCNGIPGDGVGDFVSSFVNNAKEDKMRLTAWLAFDCVLPLGPDALAKIIGAVEGFADDHMGQNSLFQKFQGFLPGGIGDKKNLILGALKGSQSSLQSQIDAGITQDGLLGKVKEWVDFGDRGMDMAAVAIDTLTNYFEHTGIQSVSRRVVSRAYGEI